MQIISESPSDTRRLAESLAPRLQAGDFLALQGDLGAGKTFFVQSLCVALGFSRGVRSPTFVLLHHYPVGGASHTIHHFDLYRLQDETELEDLGYEDYFYGDGLCVVEWAERAGTLLPAVRLDIRFEMGTSEEQRTISIEAHGDRPAGILQGL